VRIVDSMLVYTRARFKPKKKRKVRGVIATKYDAKKYMDSKSVYAPRDRRPPRAKSEVVMQAKSLVSMFKMKLLLRVSELLLPITRVLISMLLTKQILKQLEVERG
jgi:hypothetical protein